MTVLLYEDRFADLVADGSKTTTIRTKRKHPIKVGDELSHRKWEGKAYRSKQVKINRGTARQVCSFRMGFGMVEIDGKQVRANALDDLAFSVGFKSFAEMETWLEDTHGLPFDGVLIRW